LTKYYLNTIIKPVIKESLTRQPHHEQRKTAFNFCTRLINAFYELGETVIYPQEIEKIAKYSDLVEKLQALANILETSNFAKLTEGRADIPENAAVIVDSNFRSIGIKTGEEIGLGEGKFCLILSPFLRKGNCCIVVELGKVKKADGESFCYSSVPLIVLEENGSLTIPPKEQKSGKLNLYVRTLFPLASQPY